LMNLFCSNGAKVEYKHKIYKDICTEDHAIARAELYMETTDFFFLSHSSYNKGAKIEYTHTHTKVYIHRGPFDCTGGA